MLSSLAISLLLGVLPLSAVAADVTPSPPSESPTSKPTPVWYSRVNTEVPGAFAPVRSFNATYSLTWGGMQAAHIDAQCVSSPAKREIRSTFKATTTGAARALYKLDATHVSVLDRATLQPVYLEQTELNSKKHTFSRVDFTPEEATRVDRDLKKDEHDPTALGKTRRYRYPGLHDMQSVLLYVRSMPLATGDEETLAFMTSSSPYLATIKVLGRSRVKVKAGEFTAIECSLQLEKINKSGLLEPRKGFKSAHAWISDDANRLLIKADSEVFIGSVSLELEQVTFPDAAPR